MKSANCEALVALLLPLSCIQDCKEVQFHYSTNREENISHSMKWIFQDTHVEISVVTQVCYLIYADGLNDWYVRCLLLYTSYSRLSADTVYIKCKLNRNRVRDVRFSQQWTRSLSSSRMWRLVVCAEFPTLRSSSGLSKRGALIAILIAGPEKLLCRTKQGPAFWYMC